MDKNRSKGITLIALVVTIIVLLLLAGISVQMLTGDNGILQKAGEAKDITNQKQNEEKVRIAYNTAIIEDLNNGHKKIQESTLITELGKVFSESTIDLDIKGEKWKVIIDNGNPIEIEPGETSINETNVNEQITALYLEALNSGEKTKSEITKEIQEDIDSAKASILVTPCGNNIKISYVRTDNKYLMTPNGEIREYEKTPITEVWYKIDGTTIYFRNNQEDNSYNNSYSTVTNSQKANITKAVFETTVVPDNVENWFGNYKMLTQIDHLEYLDTSNVTSLYGMFGNCKKLKNLDLSSFDTSNVTNMCAVFMHCGILENLNILNWDTSNVETMGNMFSCCNKLQDINLSDFDTHNVKFMQHMFNYCETVTSLDLKTFDTSKVTTMECMFRYCNNLTSIKVSSSWKTSEENTDMFTYCGTNQLTLEE